MPQVQPFPLIDDIIMKTRNCKYFTTLDINSAFWSIPLRIEDRKKQDLSLKMDTFNGPVYLSD